MQGYQRERHMKLYISGLGLIALVVFVLSLWLLRQTWRSTWKFPGLFGIAAIACFTIPDALLYPTLPA